MPVQGMGWQVVLLRPQRLLLYRPPSQLHQAHQAWEGLLVESAAAAERREHWRHSTNLHASRRLGWTALGYTDGRWGHMGRPSILIIGTLEGLLGWQILRARYSLDWDWDLTNFSECSNSRHVSCCEGW